VHFSIVTVVKNDLPGLSKSRKSLEDQEFTNWTHIIIDGGSTDGTTSYLNLLPKENTIFISESDSGIYDAMNKAWRLAAEESFVFYLNARDVMTDPKSLTYAQQALSVSANSNWGCTTHEESFEDGSGWVCKLVSMPSVRNQLYAFGYRSHQAVVMRKSFIEDLGGFNEDLKIAADWDLIVRAIQAEEPATWMHPLAKFELGGMSSGRMLEAHLELRKLREEHLQFGFFDKIVDDLWCAVYLQIFAHQNYWTHLLRFVFPKGKKVKRKIRQRRKRNFIPSRFRFLFQFLKLLKAFRFYRRIPSLKRKRLKIRLDLIQYTLQKSIRRYLGISDYL
jgi:glycosyltransferase involved in cell wall biosynthesis